MPAPALARESTVTTSSLEERIQRRAYELYIRRGNQPGSEMDDWLQAEEEIRRAEEEAHDGRLPYLFALPPESMAAHWSPER